MAESQVERAFAAQGGFNESPLCIMHLPHADLGTPCGLCALRLLYGSASTEKSLVRDVP